MKKIKKRKREKKPFKYQIIITQNKVQCEHVGNYKNIASVLKKFNEIKEYSENNVHVPVKYKNSNGSIHEVKHELVILKIKDEHDTSDIRMTNELGKYIPTNVKCKYGAYSKYGKANKHEYVIFNKSDYFIEEKFWVYGFHPKYDRKDASFIYHNIIEDFKKNKSSVGMVICYKNKLLIDNNTKISLIICKNENDAIRLYTFLENSSQTGHIHNIIWRGIAGKLLKYSVIDKIKALTGWNLKKITRNSTRP